MPFTRREFIIKSGLAAGSAIAISSAPKMPEKQTGDRLILLGTQGGPVVRSFKPGPSANVISFKNIPFVIDAGYGVTFKLVEAGIALRSIKHIFITHHHSDHNLELGPLLYNCWIGGLSTPIHVYAPIGLVALLDSYWQSNRFDIDARIQDEGRPDIRSLVINHEINEGTILSDDNITVSALRNIHPPIKESYAFKFQLGNKTLVFSGDTTYCPALGAFSAEADYLIHEVMYGPAVDALVKRRAPNAKHLKESILSHHTLAEDVGRIANEAKAKNLVLTHFVPADDPSLTDKVWKDSVAATFKGNIIVGKDMMEIAL